MTTEGGELLTVLEVASILKVPKQTAYEAMHKMKHYRIGRHLRVTRQALTAWLEQNATEAVHTAPAPARRPPGALVPFRAASAAPHLYDAGPPIRITQPRKRKAPVGRE